MKVALGDEIPSLGKRYSRSIRDVLLSDACVASPALSCRTGSTGYSHRDHILFLGLNRRLHDCFTVAFGREGVSIVKKSGSEVTIVKEPVEDLLKRARNLLL
ncbi:uncharacterized protein L3040_005272 [Drepanopeziza brunnea f. sp. 'multigermtubi']|uniref:uncharacterized protein n=1 Tax=Drepanopeziza brunnea f. sp. 'multigermtubi' TaxID=698441 RepID=UPI00239969CF|nr:hypothetical protein L3040_005272 [Drepanopeziza brunnea f. sp. 'multigermtubi']